MPDKVILLGWVSNIAETAISTYTRTGNTLSIDETILLDLVPLEPRRIPQGTPSTQSFTMKSMTTFYISVTRASLDWIIFYGNLAGGEQEILTWPVSINPPPLAPHASFIACCYSFEIGTTMRGMSIAGSYVVTGWDSQALLLPMPMRRDGTPPLTGPAFRIAGQPILKDVAMSLGPLYGTLEIALLSDTQVCLSHLSSILLEFKPI